MATGMTHKEARDIAAEALGYVLDNDTEYMDDEAVRAYQEAHRLLAVEPPSATTHSYTVGQLMDVLSHEDPDALVVTNVWLDEVNAGDPSTVEGHVSLVVKVASGVALKGHEAI